MDPSLLERLAKQSFEGTVHSRRHKNCETESKTTFFYREALSEQLKEDEPRCISVYKHSGSAITETEQGCLLEKERLLE